MYMFHKLGGVGRGSFYRLALFRLANFFLLISCLASNYAHTTIHLARDLDPNCLLFSSSCLGRDLCSPRTRLARIIKQNCKVQQDLTFFMYAFSYPSKPSMLGIHSFGYTQVTYRNCREACLQNFHAIASIGAERNLPTFCGCTRL